MAKPAPSPNSAASAAPAGTTSDLYPSLCYEDAPAAIEWLGRAFGFARRMVVPGPGGMVMHSELSLGNAVIMVGSPRPERDVVPPRRHQGTSHGLCVRVDELDAHYARAKAAGARITRELQTEEYGARGYMAQDPEGHSWYFGDYRPGAYWSDDSPGGAPR